MRWLIGVLILLCGCSSRNQECTPEEKQAIVQTFLSKVESDTNQKLEKVIQNTGLNKDQKQVQISEIIKKIEPQIRSSADISRVKSKTCRFSYNENSIQDSTLELEQKARAKVSKWWDSQMGKSQESLSQEVGAFIHTVVESHSLVNRVNVEEGAEDPSAAGTLVKPALPASEESSETDFETAVREVLETRYARHELGAVYENTSVSEDAGQSGIPYQFKSPEGEFLDKNQDLYSKIHNSNPYHEQGRISRHLALFALQTADREFAKKLTANSAYEIGKALMNLYFEETLTSDKKPVFSKSQAKNIYNVLSGRDFLTGRLLSVSERADFILEIIMSPDDPGSFTAHEPSLKAFNDTLSKIHAGALKANSPFVQTGFKAVIEQSYEVLKERGKQQQQKVPIKNKS